MTAIEDRMELLFLYETKDCNPNGDPLDENRPRTDPDTGQALVTDVRIKRTTRDYLFDVVGEEILVRDTFDEQGYLRDGKGRARDFFEDADLGDADNIQEAVEKVRSVVLENCIDARLFGSTLPVDHDGDSSSIKVTGPVQFSGFSRSLHRVNPQFVQGTAAFASKEGATQKSFREDFVLPYACIATYGVINEVAAQTSGLTEDDVDLLLEALWNGTKSLVSRSKMGHQPLFLMRIRHNDRRQIGDLAGQVALRTDKDDVAIRNVSDYQIDVTTLAGSLGNHADEIASVEIQQDPRLEFVGEDGVGAFEEAIGDAVSISGLW